MLYVSANGRQIRLSGTFGDKGTAGVVGSVVLIPVAGFFVTDTSAVVPMGAPVIGSIGEDVPVSMSTAKPDLAATPVYAAPASAPGDPWASTASLQRAAKGELRITRVGQDHYGRSLAMVAGDRGDLQLLAAGTRQAIDKARWDDGLRVARTCQSATS